MPSAVIRSKAPLRTSFGGGGTDVPPYPDEDGGPVSSGPIEKYAYCTLATRNDDSIYVKPPDCDVVATDGAEKRLVHDGELDPVKADVRVPGLGSCLDLFLDSDSFPGLGLGTSAALTVAIAGAFRRWLVLPLTPYEIADLAYRIEREEVGIGGGRQYQYAATFGGFSFIESLRRRTIVNPLRVDRKNVNELQNRSMLCHVGGTRVSAGIIAEQVRSHIEKKNGVGHALSETKEPSSFMKKAFLLGNMDQLALLLHDAW